ncbi:SubName: Full=Uncharacterized protein {ECO:0000313/EMBL:CCA77032.1}; Flags: Fragment [Serendipita indica DSM 11827]|nr:SubName: Full=Uncharacterized protein {ECO:0000313/EMBL:CCA77032.1}; Flags: Fragment [Serendipita indica DSM 11827]
MLGLYAEARAASFKEETIQKAFRKTGIWPVNKDALQSSDFELSLATTTAVLLPDPDKGALDLLDMTLEASNKAIGIVYLIAADPPVEQDKLESHIAANPSQLPADLQDYDVPAALRACSMPALPDQNVDSSVLRSRIREYEQVIAAQSAQLMVSATWNKLFHLENGQLRQIALKKTTRQKNKFLNTKARVMTSPEGLDEIKADEERRAAKAAEKAAKAVARAEKAELKGKRGTGGQKGQKVRFQVKDNTSDTASDAATSDSDTDRLSNAQPTHRTTRSGLSAKSNSTGLHADPSKAPQAAAQDTPVTLRRGRSATAQKESPKRLSTGIKSGSSQILALEMLPPLIQSAFP